MLNTGSNRAGLEKLAHLQFWVANITGLIREKTGGAVLVGRWGRLSPYITENGDIFQDLKNYRCHGFSKITDQETAGIMARF